MSSEDLQNIGNEQGPLELTVEEILRILCTALSRHRTSQKRRFQL